MGESKAMAAGRNAFVGGRIPKNHPLQRIFWDNPRLLQAKGTNKAESTERGYCGLTPTLAQTPGCGWIEGMLEIRQDPCLGIREGVAHPVGLGARSSMGL